MHGYCYATNEYLSSLLNCEGRSIQNWLASLKKEGYLEIETEKNGIHWQRRLYLSDKFKKCLRKENPFTPPCSDFHPPMKKDSPIKEEYSKEEYKKESPIVPKGDPLPSRRKKIKQEKIEVAPGVWLTKTQKEDILRRLDNDAEKVAAAYDKLSKWKIKKSIVGGSDYSHLTGWVKRSVEEDLAKPKPVDRTECDKAIASQIEAKFPNHPDIVIGYNYIEFKRGRETPHLKFGDHGFQEQVENNLRKLGLRL